jgi:hypothetical protein
MAYILKCKNGNGYYNRWQYITKDINEAMLFTEEKYAKKSRTLFMKVYNQYTAYKNLLHNLDLEIVEAQVILPEQLTEKYQEGYDTGWKEALWQQEGNI